MLVKARNQKLINAREFCINENVILPNFATQQNMCRRKMDENKVNEVKRYLQQFIKLSNMT